MSTRGSYGRGERKRGGRFGGKRAKEDATKGGGDRCVGEEDGRSWLGSGPKRMRAPASEDTQVIDGEGSGSAIESSLVNENLVERVVKGAGAIDELKAGSFAETRERKARGEEGFTDQRVHLGDDHAEKAEPPVPVGEDEIAVGHFNPPLLELDAREDEGEFDREEEVGAATVGADDGERSPSHANRPLSGIMTSLRS